MHRCDEAGIPFYVVNNTEQGFGRWALLNHSEPLTCARGYGNRSGNFNIEDVFRHIQLPYCCQGIHMMFFVGDGSAVSALAYSTAFFAKADGNATNVMGFQV